MNQQEKNKSMLDRLEAVNWVGYQLLFKALLKVLSKFIVKLILSFIPYIIASFLFMQLYYAAGFERTIIIIAVGIMVFWTKQSINIKVDIEYLKRVKDGVRKH